jgi:hypothetical protein
MDHRCKLCGAPSDAPAIEQDRFRGISKRKYYTNNAITENLIVRFYPDGFNLQLNDQPLSKWSFEMLRRNIGKTDLASRPITDDGRYIGEIVHLTIENMTNEDLEAFQSLRLHMFTTIVAIKLMDCFMNLDAVMTSLHPGITEMIVGRGGMTLTPTLPCYQSIQAVKYGEMSLEHLGRFLLLPNVETAYVSDVMYIPYSAKCAMEFSDTFDGFQLDDDVIQTLKRYKSLRAVKVRILDMVDVHFAMKLFIACRNLCELQGSQFCMVGPDENLLKFYTEWVHTYKRGPALAPSMEALYNINKLKDARVYFDKTTVEPPTVSITLVKMLEEVKKQIGEEST